MHCWIFQRGFFKAASTDDQDNPALSSAGEAGLTTVSSDQTTAGTPGESTASNGQPGHMNEESLTL